MTTPVELASLVKQPFELLREIERRSAQLHSGAAGTSQHAEWVGVGFRVGEEQFLASRDQVREVLMLPEAMTRVSHAKMALEYIHLIGGTAYLPKRMVEKDLSFGLLHAVTGAPSFERQAYATYPVRSSKLNRIEEALTLIRGE